MAQQKQDYIEYSKRMRYNEELEYLAKFNLTSHNLKRFEDKIDAIVTSIDTEIRSSMAYVAELQQNLDEKSNKPELKALVDDPWYKIYHVQSSLVKYLIRSGGFKTWMIKFLVVSNNKLAEFLDNINENLVELKKVEMQAEMYKQMYTNLEEIRKSQQQQQSHYANQDYEKQIQLLQQQLTGQREAMVSMTEQVAMFKDMIRELERRDTEIRQKSAEIDKKSENLVQKPVKYKEVELIEPETDDDDEEVDADNEDYYIDNVEGDDEDDEDAEEIEESDDDDDADVDENYDDESDDDNTADYQSKKKDNGIEFDDFDEEVKFFKEFTQDLNFTDDNSNELMLILNTVDEIELAVGKSRGKYKGARKREDMLGQMAFMHNNFVYDKDALCDFLQCTKSALTRSMKKLNLQDRLLLEE